MFRSKPYLVQTETPPGAVFAEMQFCKGEIASALKLMRQPIIQEVTMVEFSRGWVQAFRAVDDMDDLCFREAEGKRPDDRQWWKEHEKEIGFFFSTLQELHLGYFERSETEQDLVFHTRKGFKRFLLKNWEPIVLDI